MLKKQYKTTIKYHFNLLTKKTNMSESAKINLIGFDKETLISNIEKIRAWDNNNNFPIIVIGHEGKEHYDTIDNVANAIYEDRIGEYLTQKEVIKDEDASKPKQIIKPDSVHKGSIDYEIRWYGKQAQIVVTNSENNFHARVAMLHQVHVDLGILLENIKNEPKKVKAHFANTDKTRVIHARFLIDKFVTSYLNRIWFEDHLSAEEKAEILEAQIKEDDREVKDLIKETEKSLQQLNDLDKQAKNKMI